MPSLLLPAVVLMLITLLVWLNMFIRRIVASKALGVDPQEMITPERLNAVLPESVQAPANCFKNLFEMPVIFYAVTCFILLSNAADSMFINLAWSFVVLRALQACVHCTYNRVMHRFLAYLFSSIVLWVMVVRFFLVIY